MLLKILEHAGARDICNLEQTCKWFRGHLLHDASAWRAFYLSRSAGTHCAEYAYTIYPLLKGIWKSRASGEDDTSMPASVIWKWLFRARFCALPALEDAPSDSYEIGTRVFLQLRLGHWVQLPASAWSIPSAPFVPPNDTLYLVSLCGAWSGGKLNGPGIAQTVGSSATAR